MEQHCGRTVWVRERGRHRSKERASSRPLVDYSNHGNGNGKKSRISSKLHLDVSFLYEFF